MSYNILDDVSSNLLEGIVFIGHNYPYYDKNKLEDSYSNMKYSIQMILHSIEGIVSIEKFYKIIIFDILIGNSDRHHSNWAIISKREKETNSNIINVTFDFCPLYDNGSSLCAYEDNSNLSIFFYEKIIKNVYSRKKTKNVRNI